MKKIKTRVKSGVSVGHKVALSILIISAFSLGLNFAAMSMQLPKTTKFKKVKVPTLNVCDHNNDGLRNQTDVGILASCPNFDADGNGIHNLNDVAQYSANSQSNTWCATNFVCEPVAVPTLNVCDHNNDGLRNLADVSKLASCPNFDADDNGTHNLNDVVQYAANSQSNTWCATNFVCDPVAVPTLNVCDHNNDGFRSLVDVEIFAGCPNFDVNGDGIHNLTDNLLYEINNQDDTWCATNFVCEPPEILPCGESGQICCAGAFCDAGLVCSAGSCL